ncbi:MAG: hypothetical protein ACLU0O_05495 [Collinsella sp.]
MNQREQNRMIAQTIYRDIAAYTKDNSKVCHLSQRTAARRKPSLASAQGDTNAEGLEQIQSI